MTRPWSEKRGLWSRGNRKQLDKSVQRCDKHSNKPGLRPKVTRTEHKDIKVTHGAHSVPHPVACPSNPRTRHTVFLAAVVHSPRRCFATVDYGTDMATSKNHTMHNQSPKWHRNPDCKDTISERGRTQVPEEYAFCQEKDLKKMQANNTKSRSACPEAVKALVKPKEVKPKMPKGVNCKLA
ncbi:60S ribosomal protein L29 [Fukomys damarensis]|uniref:60S ribosomal protein L29 n=1 Tax=Fukomys damarensis TaxID=885580 RepID=A0A091E8D1_FUKDA|nr:60S ribosomal protein L29 [Fukomys damarensis]